MFLGNKGQWTPTFPGCEESWNHRRWGKEPSLPLNNSINKAFGNVKKRGVVGSEAVIGMANWAGGGVELQHLAALSCDASRLPEMAPIAEEETTGFFGAPKCWLICLPNRNGKL